ncbi:MAG TPA: glycosyltransferase family 4 protein [Verrucomicrobiae bacterium]|nr:glycosyltransferase family 4 protein [Verrucomicrobiae bacterium]
MQIAFLAHDIREPFKEYDRPTPFFNPGVEALLVGFANFPEVEVHMISCTQQPMRAPEKLAERVWYHSLHVPKIGWLRTGYQGCIRAVRRKLREIQPDIAHGYGTERDCALSAIFSGFPNVVSIQGNMAELARLNRPRIGSYLWLTARLENFTMRRTPGVICNSIYTENLVRPRAHKTWLVYPALLPAFLEPVPDHQPGKQSCTLLNVGVISPRKRQLELLDVAESLHRRGLKFEFWFVGRATEHDPYTRAFLERLKPMEAAGFVRYLGRLSFEELLRTYDSADGMIHFSAEEAFGLNVAEALARNLKFFGSQVGGIVEIAQDVPGAELFAKDNWAGLTDAIARWIAQGHPCPSAAHQLMHARYHPQTVARQHMAIYQEVLSVQKR